MVKTKIVETTEKYDKDGKLVEKITREEITEDNTVYESGEIYYPKEPKYSCWITDGELELKVEDIARSVNEYYKRMGKSPFCF